MVYKACDKQPCWSSSSLILVSTCIDRCLPHESLFRPQGHLIGPFYKCHQSEAWLLATRGSDFFVLTPQLWNPHPSKSRNEPSLLPSSRNSRLICYVLRLLLEYCLLLVLFFSRLVTVSLLFKILIVLIVCVFFTEVKSCPGPFSVRRKARYNRKINK